MTCKYIILLTVLLVNTAQADWLFEKRLSNSRDESIAFAKTTYDGGNATIWAMCELTNIRFRITFSGSPLQPTYADYLYTYEDPNTVTVQYRIDKKQLQTFKKQIVRMGGMESAEQRTDVVKMDMNSSHRLYTGIITGQKLAMKFINKDGESNIIRPTLSNAYIALINLKKQCVANNQDI